MDGPRWIVEEIAGASGSPVKHRLDASVQRSSPQRVGIARLPKTDAEFGTRIGRKDQPAFILSARKARLPRRFVVGMNLDRQPLGCEKKFDQQRRIVAGRVFEPYLADPPPGEIAKGHGHVDPAPGLDRKSTRLKSS